MPIKHCMLNPIELSWSGLKRYVRDNDTNFHLSDVRKLAERWMGSLDPSTLTSYHDHVQKIQNTYKTSDNFVGTIEEQIIDDNIGKDSDMQEPNG